MNNNIYTNNNFIGSTHLDGLKPLSNLIISTSNILEQHIAYSNISSSNFTLSTSNILETHLLATSNILETHSSNFTNALRYDVNKWINEEVEHITVPIPIDLTHTYIYNSNILGEIRFVTNGTPKYATNNNNNYTIKIKENGRLSIFYQYNILYPTVLGGWYDIMDSVRDAYAFQAGTNSLIGGLQSEINNINNQLGPIEIIVEKHNIDIVTLESQVSLLNSINYIQQMQYKTYPELVELVELSKTGGYFNVYNNPILAGIGVDTVVGVAGGVVGSALYASYISEQAQFLYYSSNSNITSNQKYFLKSNMDEIVVSSIGSFGSNIRRLNDINGSINCNILTQQFIPNLKCDNLYLNNGNISGINYVNVNNIVADGKIKENNKFLDTTYLTSNHIYNLAYTYTAERQYPPKLYNNTSTEDTVSLLGKLVYRQILYLDNQSIAYGSGFYELYSSSTYDTPTTKDRLFNRNTSETTTSPRFAINLYNSGTGNYQGDNSINNIYFGDWVIIKMPQQILLTRYRIYQRSDFLTKAPAEWKVYGSNDGITFTEITEASQMTRLSSYTSGFYEKTLASTFTTQYQYFGFTFGKLLSTSGQTDLSFSELQLFGKEIISNSIVSNIYTTSNVVKSIVRYDMPDVGKRQAFVVNIPSSSVFVDGTTSTTFYKYDLDLTKYTKTLNIPAPPNDPYRVFRIRCWYAPSYFGSFINGEPYVVSYEVYMSNKTNPIFGQPLTAGINIYAVGFPENTKLSNILPNQIMVLKNFNSNFNYLTLLSRTAPADLLVIIEDLLF